MASSLVDSPPVAQGAEDQAPLTAQAPSADAPAPRPSADGAAPQPAPDVRPCTKCGAPLAAGQDWCLQCGAGAPGSLGASGWRSAATVLAAVVALALGAAAAAYAAFGEGPGKGRVLTTTVAQAPPPVSTVPTPTTSTPITPVAPVKTPKAGGGAFGLGSAKPPKIPLGAITPKASEKAGGGGTSTSGQTETTSTTPSGAGGESSGEKGAAGEEAQAAILLDTNAAKTYNPYEYPASWFGDPSQAIDGDHTTAWTAQVNPATAPKMAEGLIVDLKSKQKVGVLQMITSTPGMTVQVYGSQAASAPTTITDRAWVPLSSPKLDRKRKLRFSLRDSHKAFTFITLWISKAPAAAVGTPAAPGAVSIDELELFPPR